MTTRDKNLFFETLELLRKELQKSDDFRGQDWRDVDDWLFAQLSFTRGELREIYQGRGVMCDTTSAVPTACAFLAQYLGRDLRLCRNSGPDNEFGPSCEVYAMVEGMPTLFTSQKLPILSKYIGRRPAWKSIRGPGTFPSGLERRRFGTPKAKRQRMASAWEFHQRRGCFEGSAAHIRQGSRGETIFPHPHAKIQAAPVTAVRFGPRPISTVRGLCNRGRGGEG